MCIVVMGFLIVRETQQCVCAFGIGDIVKEKHGFWGNIRKSGTRMFLTTKDPLGGKVDGKVACMEQSSMSFCSMSFFPCQ